MFIARNKKTGTETKVTAAQKDKLLASPLSKKKFTFRPISDVPTPVEAKKTKAKKGE